MSKPDTITVAFESRTNRTPSGIYVFDDIFIDGRHVGWVDMENRRVTILAGDGSKAWVEVTCKRKRSGIKSYWIAARKVFPGVPVVGPAYQLGNCIKEE